MNPSRLLPALTVLALAACEPLPSGPTPPSTDNSDTCNAAALSSQFVGQDASLIFATTFTAPIRVIRSGDAVTMDFNPARINFAVDTNERVTQVYCG